MISTIPIEAIAIRVSKNVTKGLMKALISGKCIYSNNILLTYVVNDQEEESPFLMYIEM